MSIEVALFPALTGTSVAKLVRKLKLKRRSLGPEDIVGSVCMNDGAYYSPG